jgi:hypothetical protein
MTEITSQKRVMGEWKGGERRRGEGMEGERRGEQK